MTLLMPRYHSLSIMPGCLYHFTNAEIIMPLYFCPHGHTPVLMPRWSLYLCAGGHARVLMPKRPYLYANTQTVIPRYYEMTMPLNCGNA